MKGTTIKYTPKQGKPTWGYCFDAGRDESGKRMQKVRRGFTTKAKAETALRDAIESLHNVPAADRAMPTFAQFFERWHREYAAVHCAPKTAERYHELGQAAIRLFGDSLLDKLDTMILAQALNQLSAHGGRVTKGHPDGMPLAPKTVGHIAFVVQRCLGQAVDWELIPKNPMEKVRKPKLVKRRPKVIDSEGLASLLGSIRGQRIYPVIALAAATGMRRGELLAIEWTDLNLATRSLTVSKSLEQTQQGLRIKGTKSGRERHFAVPRSILLMLAEHREQQDQEKHLYGADYADLNLVFARPDGGYYSPDKVGSRTRYAMKLAGLEGFSLHSLRHSHASELLSRGAPITAVSERLGHSTPNITLGIYSHALPQDNQAAANLWEGALGHILANQKGGMLSNVITMPSEKPVKDLKSAG